jgi:hypothetical protein
MKAMKYMSKLFCSLVMAALLLNTSEAQNSGKKKSDNKEALIKHLIDSQNFVFKAQSVMPLGGRTRQLTSDYDLRVSKGSVVSYLPYFGRAYSATPGATGGIEFTSKDFEYNIKENKKGGWDVVIKPKDTHDVRELFLTIFKNGRADLLVTSTDRQNISYTGYITENKQKD